MELYAIVDENLKVARHLSKGTAGVFATLPRLNKNAWRYMQHTKTYKVAKFEITDVFELGVYLKEGDKE
ncbi:TPA: hypothetical protein PNM99_002392 [Listeria monocytogenes]|nr:hypothetical protein [Listeria monocytogenes]